MGSTATAVVFNTTGEVAGVAFDEFDVFRCMDDNCSGVIVQRIFPNAGGGSGLELTNTDDSRFLLSLGGSEGLSVDPAVASAPGEEETEAETGAEVETEVLTSKAVFSLAEVLPYEK
jgi:hypothetical protein